MRLFVNHNPKKQLQICRSHTCLHVATISLLLATSFLANPDFFNSLITVMQWGLEQVLLLTAISLVVSHSFIKAIRFSTVDLLVLFYCGWHVLSEALILESPYILFPDTIFSVAICLIVSLFLSSAIQKRPHATLISLTKIYSGQTDEGDKSKSSTKMNNIGTQNYWENSEKHLFLIK